MLVGLIVVPALQAFVDQLQQALLHLLQRLHQRKHRFLVAKMILQIMVKELVVQEQGEYVQICVELHAMALGKPVSVLCQGIGYVVSLHQHPLDKLYQYQQYQMDQI